MLLEDLLTTLITCFEASLTEESVDLFIQPVHFLELFQGYLDVVDFNQAAPHHFVYGRLVNSDVQFGIS